MFYSRHSLSIIFAALATAIGISVCCPIGQCVQLPNIASYTRTANSYSTPLQARVNVSTTDDLAFRPNFFKFEIQNTNNMVLPGANGCEGKYGNYTSRKSGVDSPCPWTYECDYNPQRIPAFIFTARCDSDTPQGIEWEDRVCEEVYYPLSYVTTKSCNPIGDSTNTEWKFITKIIPVSCHLQYYV